MVAESIVFPTVSNDVAHPDARAQGFIAGQVNPLRYGNHTTDPDEAAGIISSMIPQAAKVLDVGCGIGEMTKIIEIACNATVVGVEPEDPELGHQPG